MEVSVSERIRAVPHRAPDLLVPDRLGRALAIQWQYPQVPRQRRLFRLEANSTATRLVKQSTPDLDAAAFAQRTHELARGRDHHVLRDAELSFKHWDLLVDGLRVEDLGLWI